MKARSPSTRRVWIEIQRVGNGLLRDVSPSTRRVWIEIIWQTEVSVSGVVTLHTEGVDRNGATDGDFGGVTPSPSTRRVWIEMRILTLIGCSYSVSPSTRRVWIEIRSDWTVDFPWALSPSTRRVWIEINHGDVLHWFPKRHPPHGGCG